MTVWDKVLADDEPVRHEFGISRRYRLWNWWLWFVISLLLVIVGVGLITMPIAAFYFLFYLPRARAYAFTDKRVLVHQGWLSTSLVSIDYQKITDVQVKERFLDRIIIHAGDLHLNTAGTAKTEVVLKYIDQPYEVRKQLDRIRSSAQAPATGN